MAGGTSFGTPGYNTGDQRTISVPGTTRNPWGQQAPTTQNQVQTQLQSGDWNPTAGFTNPPTTGYGSLAPYGASFGAGGQIQQNQQRNFNAGATQETQGRQLNAQGQELLSAATRGLGAPNINTPGIATPPNVSYQGATQQQEQAARDAAFAQAKDTAANTARASLNALTGELQSRGLGGGGYEAGQVGQELGREANTLGQVNAQLAENAYQRAGQIADEQYQGGIAQRGQNIGLGEAQASLGLQGQEFPAQIQQANQNRLAQILLGLTGQGALGPSTSTGVNAGVGGGQQFGVGQNYSGNVQYAPRPYTTTTWQSPRPY